MIHYIIVALLFLEFINGNQVEHNAPNLSAKISKFLQNEAAVEGKKWALLVAGSRYYENYRHQADVCHAYQILKKGGLKDENIIVFMYDDIAYNSDNPRPGVIINSPNGVNVYEGVPKDYTGNNASVHNLFAVILGNRSGVIGGSGKVLNTGPKDNIFIYYTDHGSAGMVEMPLDEFVYADDLIKVLKKKHESKGYESMVIYMEACESGSMFEGLLMENLNIYATTASNATENSYPTYCNYDDSLPPGYDVCLGDLYSVSWMEDSEKHDLRSETLTQQFQVVKRRTSVENLAQVGSNVMEYGNLVLAKKFLYSYIGTNKVNNNYTSTEHGNGVTSPTKKAVSQREADLLYYQQKFINLDIFFFLHQFNRAPKGSKKRSEARMQLLNEINSRKVIDNKMKEISTLLVGATNGIAMMHGARPIGQPLVDDWSCLKTFVKTYEENCGSMTSYGMKYTRAFANMCNAGITEDQMIMATTRICK
ncbi:hypothetical protein ACJIZ3_021028 [Penstemon smallii]|uniref:Legumain prodomain domain-containing protein n=1 Tax=Penstemon smallii TaxID=265156 RepID=A0ABD3SKD6_9LAMI